MGLSPVCRPRVNRWAACWLVSIISAPRCSLLLFSWIRCPMATSLPLTSSHPPLRLSLCNHRPPNSSTAAATCSLPVISLTPFSGKRPLLLLLQPSPPHEIPRKLRRGCTVSAAAEVALPSPADAPQIVSSAGDDGVSTVISVLLITAFIGLSVLTIGVKWAHFPPAGPHFHARLHCFILTLGQVVIFRMWLAADSYL